MAVESNTELFHSMNPQDALSLYSETSVRYRITWECGRAEAAERQRRAGVGSVTEDGYMREVGHEFFANQAAGDPEATVEEI